MPLIICDGFLTHRPFVYASCHMRCAVRVIVSANGKILAGICQATCNTHLRQKNSANRIQKNDVLLGLEASNLEPHRFQTVSTGHMEHGQSDYLPLQPFHIASIASWVSVLQPGYSPQIAAPGRLALEPTRSHPGGAGSAPLWETSARYI